MSPVRIAGRIVGVGTLITLLPAPAWAHISHGAAGEIGWTDGVLFVLGPLLLALAWKAVVHQRDAPTARHCGSTLTVGGGVGSRPDERCGFRVSRIPYNSTLAALFSLWMLTQVVATAPHLVHHLLDHGGVDCAFMRVAHHTPGTLTDPVSVAEPLLIPETQPPSRVPCCAPREVVPSPSRSPPVVPASAAL
jgi:hypothetical protein